MSRWEGEVSVVIGSQKYTGRYRVGDKGILTVYYGGDSKSTHHRRPESPKPLAEILLSELVGQAHEADAT